MQNYLLFSQLLLLPLFLQLLLAPAPGLNMQHKQQNHIHSVCATFSMQQLSTANTPKEKSTAKYLNKHLQQTYKKKYNMSINHFSNFNLVLFRAYLSMADTISWKDNL
jgi:hypothetical protein